jgi:hypothetical protein
MELFKYLLRNELLTQVAVDNFFPIFDKYFIFFLIPIRW